MFIVSFLLGGGGVERLGFLAELLLSNRYSIKRIVALWYVVLCTVFKTKTGNVAKYFCFV